MNKTELSNTPAPRSVVQQQDCSAIPHEALAGAIRALEGLASESRCEAINQNNGMRPIFLDRAKTMEGWVSELKRWSITLCNG